MAEPGPEMPVVIRREVAATPAEYARGLRLAYPDGVSGGPLAYLVSDGRARLQVSLAEGPERRIALMRLPSLHVTLRFVAGSAEERRRMLAHMDLAMRRGGG